MNARRLRKLEPYLLLLPSVIYLIFFFAWPMIRGFGLIFRTEEGQWTLRYVQRMVNDVSFLPALRTTLLYVVILIPIQFVVALTMALLVTGGIRASGLLIYFYSIPIAVSDLAAGIVWFSIFTERGYLNTVLQGLGLLDKPFIFLNPQTPWPVFAVILAEVWRATSIVFVILVAGLQGIPKEYFEAAEVFGANWLTRLWRVTLPMLRPSIQVALLLRTILAFNVFGVVLTLTGEGVRVLAAESYKWYRDYRNPSVAAAYAGVIMLLAMSVGAVYLRALRVQEAERM
jgi:multiple sugar transport system permease protein